MVPNRSPLPSVSLNDSAADAIVRRPGIKDVAARSGVSIKTVSRVVNAEPSVRPATRNRVLVAIESLGYVPNTAARSLKSGVAGVIGVVIDSLADPFFAALVSAIEERALTEGLSVLIGSTGLDPVREREQLLSLAAGHQVSGIIFAPVANDLSYLDPFRALMPVVAVDRAHPLFDSVVVDDYEATQTALRPLIALGHRRIAFYDQNEQFLTIRRRYRAYLDVLDEAAIPFDAELVAWANESPFDHAAETQRLLNLSDPATAFFASNAKAAIGLVTSLHHMGREETAMVAFGDFTLAGVLKPAVSCIDQDPYLIGTEAIERLLQLRASPGDTPREWIVPTSFVQRGSGEIPPTRPASQSGLAR